MEKVLEEGNLVGDDEGDEVVSTLQARKLQ